MERWVGEGGGGIVLGFFGVVMSLVSCEDGFC